MRMRLVMFLVSCAVRGGWQSQFFCSESGTGEETATLKYPDPAASQALRRPLAFFQLQVRRFPVSLLSLRGIYRLAYQFYRLENQSRKAG